MFKEKPVISNQHGALAMQCCRFSTPLLKVVLALCIFSLGCRGCFSTSFPTLFSHFSVKSQLNAIKNGRKSTLA